MRCAAPLEPPARHGLEGVDEIHIGRGTARSVVRTHESGVTRLVLTLDDARASSAHARVVRQDGAWTFEDLGSKNGSFVNGLLSRGAVLADGDCLQIGQTLFVLRTAMPTPARTAIDIEAPGRAPGLATLVPLLARELDVLATAAASRTPLLLMSETGTGKEVV